MNKPSQLRLNPYRPDFRDPRVQRRVRAVLNWAKPLLIRNKPTPVPSHELTRVFGNQNSRLAAYLRANLLIQSGHYIVNQRFYDYRIHRTGFDKLSAAVAAEIESDVEIASDLYGDIARGAVAIEYTEPSPGRRRYHAVQNLPRALRSQVFAGWWDCDIEAAAPSLVLQYAQRASVEEGAAEPYPTLRRLVSDKVQLRAQVQAATGLSPPDVKRVLNGLFFGAKLQASPHTAIYAITGGSKDLLGRLQAEPVIQALIAESKQMWSELLALDDGQRTGSSARTARRRMAIYLSLEREVIEAMERALASAGVRYVLMHDGFMADRPVDASRLQEAVRIDTGFTVSLTAVELSMKADTIHEIEDEARRGTDDTEEIDALEGVDS